VRAEALRETTAAFSGPKDYRKYNSSPHETIKLNPNSHLGVGTGVVLLLCFRCVSVKTDADVHILHDVYIVIQIYSCKTVETVVIQVRKNLCKTFDIRICVRARADVLVSETAQAENHRDQGNVGTSVHRISLFPKRTEKDRAHH
jgi:hypothetical protein